MLIQSEEYRKHWWSDLDVMTGRICIDNAVIRAGGRFYRMARRARRMRGRGLRSLTA